MADISKLSRLINGAQRNVDLLSNTLLTQNVKIGGAVNYMTFDVSAVAGARTITMPNASVDLGDMLSKTLASGYIYVGNGSGVAAAVLPVGDVTIDNAGNTAIGANKVVTSMINADAVDKTKINADVAGLGLVQAVGGELDVNVDGSTLEIASDTVRVKDLGITGGKIANLTIDDGKISTTAAIAFSKMAALTLDRVLISSGAGVVTVSAVTSTTLTYLDATSSIQTQLDARLKLDGTNTMTGDLNMGGNKVFNVGAPTAAGDAATKAYVDANIAGLDIQPDVIQYVDSGAFDPGATPTLGDRYILDTATPHANFGTITGFGQGDIVEYDGVEFVVDKDVSAHPAGGLLTWSTNDATFYNWSGTAWSAFGGLSGITAGIGLVKTGNVLDVKLGAGIVELPSDEVGIDVLTAGGLFLTIDGSTSSTATAAQLSIKLDGSTLSRSATGLKVADGGIAATQLATDAVETLKIKDLNVTTAKLANDAVDKTKINADIAGLGLSQAVGGELDVNVDNSTLEINSDILRIKALGVGTSHIAADAVTAAKIQIGQNINLRGRNAADTADVDILKINSSDRVEMASFFKTPASAPLADYDVVNKKYVDDKTPQALLKTFTIGENLGANTTYALRMSVNGETEGSLYKADLDASVADKWHVVALITTDGSGISAGASAVCTMIGEIASSVTFAAADIGQPVYLGASGVVTTVASTTAGYAVFKLGMVSATGVGTSKILISNMQLMGIA